MPQKTIDQLVADARSRISAMRVAPPSGEVSSRAAAAEFELAIDALVMSLPIGRTADFHEVIAKVEERFRPVYDREAVSNAKTDGQMSDASTRESTGWWIVLSRAGIAIRTGDVKPQYEVGDTIVFTLQRLPRKRPDAAPDLAIVPPAPLSPVREQLVQIRDRAPPEDRQKADALLATFDSFVGNQST